MKQRERIVMSPKQALQYRIVLLTAIIASLFLFTSAGFCQSTTVDIVPDVTVDGSVQLTPGYISGTVDLGGQNVNRIELDAKSADYSSRINQSAEGPYSMTVNVPSGSGLNYTVSGMVWMDSWTTALYFKDRTVFVEDGNASELEIIIDPGFISVEFITDGCSIAKSEVDAYLNTGDAFSRADTRRGSETIFRFPVQPNGNINVYGQVQLTNGKSVALASRMVDVYPGMDTQVTWEMNCGPGLLGAIQHDVDYHMQVDNSYTLLYSEGSSMYSRYVNHQGSYLFDNLAPGNWRVYTHTYWNNRKNLILKDLRDISVGGGETVHAVIDEYPGFLQGRVTLTGTESIQDVYSAYVYAYGKNSLYPSFRSYSKADIENSEGAFNLALPHGEWSLFVSSFFFSNPVQGDDYRNNQLLMYDYAKYRDTLFINSNETITGHDMSYETGSATIKYSRSDGGGFTSPYLYAKCYNYDESNRLDSYIYSYARGAADGETVTFVGFPGTYEVDAWATVDGSMTTFGKATVEIVAGVEKVVDIGGPVLNVTEPEPETVFTEQLILVSGTATDDMGVASVTINGVGVDLMPTNNADDPNEVSFSVELELLEGGNEIEVIAADTSGNESSDIRTVTYEVPEVIVVPEPETYEEPEVIDTPDTETYEDPEVIDDSENEMTAREHKLHAVEVLEGIETSDKKIQKNIAYAIKHLKKSLGIGKCDQDDADSCVAKHILWTDGNHVDAKHGHKVFNEESKAVKKLEKVLADKNASEDIMADCEEAINLMIDADAILAITAYNEAASYEGESKVDKELDKCDEEFSKVDEELAEGDADNVIKHYKKVWEHAQHALDKMI